MRQVVSRCANQATRSLDCDRRAVSPFGTNPINKAGQRRPSIGMKNGATGDRKKRKRIIPTEILPDTRSQHGTSQKELQNYKEPVRATNASAGLALRFDSLRTASLKRPPEYGSLFLPASFRLPFRHASLR